MPQKTTTDKARQQSVAARFRAAYQAANQTRDWTTPSGITVTVKRPDLEDRAIFEMLPAHCQTAVIESLKRTLKPDRTVKQPVADAAAGKLDGLKAAMELGLSPGDLTRLAGNLADAYVLAGWVAPRVVLDEAAITDPDAEIPLAFVAPRDRYAFMDWCQTAETEEAAGPVSFRPGQADAVEPVPGGKDVRATA